MSKSLRSPNYPRKNLPEVINRLRKFKNQLDNDTHTEEKIAQMVGYSGLTGASIPYVSAFKKFGLLNKISDNSFKFNDEAIKLAETAHGEYHDNELSDLIERIAFLPELFSEIKNYFGNTLPDRERLIDLLRRKEFVEKSILKVIESYENTFNLVASVNNKYKSEYNIGDSDRGNLNEDENSPNNGFIFELTTTISIIVDIHSLPSVADLEKLAKFRNLLETIGD